MLSLLVVNLDLTKTYGPFCIIFLIIFIICCLFRTSTKQNENSLPEPSFYFERTELKKLLVLSGFYIATGLNYY